MAAQGINELVEKTEAMNSVEKTKSVVFVIKALECFNNHRNHPYETCKSIVATDEMKLEEYAFALKMWRIFLGIVYSYYINMFLFVSIGAA